MRQPNATERALIQRMSTIERYATIGLVAYVEERIRLFEQTNFMKPAKIYLGKVEWQEVLGFGPVAELKIGGVECAPDLEVDTLVELS